MVAFDPIGPPPAKETVFWAPVYLRFLLFATEPNGRKSHVVTTSTYPTEILTRSSARRPISRRQSHQPLIAPQVDPNGTAMAA